LTGLRAWKGLEKSQPRRAAQAFHDLVVNGIAPDGSVDWSNTGIVRALREASESLSSDGWTRLEDVRAWPAAHDAEQTPEKYGCRSWPQVVSESRQFDLQ
jgi:hypothetical protein